MKRYNYYGKKSMKIKRKQNYFQIKATVSHVVLFWYEKFYIEYISSLQHYFVDEYLSISKK